MNPETTPKPEEVINNLISHTPSLKGAARTDHEGSVIEFCGEIDAETACAVTTLAARHIDELAADLGLGELRSWQLSMSETSWYVVHREQDVLVALGEANKNPSSTLKRVETSYRSVRQ